MSADEKEMTATLRRGSDRSQLRDVPLDTEGRPMPWMPAETSTRIPDVHTVRAELAGHVMRVSPSRNPKDVAGAGKVPLHLVPSAFTHAVAEVLRHGAAKYGEWNWRREAPAMSAYRSACQRHLDAWFDGEDTDADSGLPHLAHAASTLAVMLDAIANGSVIDDRPPRVAAGNT